MLNTPLGKILLLVDGEVVPYKVEQLGLVPVLFPDIQARFKICFDYDQNHPARSIKCLVENTSVRGWGETGECLEAISFYHATLKLTLGIRGSFGDAVDYGFDFDGQHLEHGIECLLSKRTASQPFVFAVSWIDPVTEDNDVQTWYASDPAIQS